MFRLEDHELYKRLVYAEELLMNSPRIKFERSIRWRKQNLNNIAGIYAIFEGRDKLIYVGETGNIYGRMSDITRTVNHSFRKKIGKKNFNGVLYSGKFNDNIEKSIDRYCDNELYFSFIEINFGRLEIETYLVHKYQDQILNSVKKRKLIYNPDLLEEAEKHLINKLSDDDNR